MPAQEKELERLVVRLMGDARQYERFLAKAKADLKKTTSDLERQSVRTTRVMNLGFSGIATSFKSISTGLRSMSSGLRSLGMRMSMFVTGPVVAMGVMGVKSFADFDQAMTESVSIMRGVTDDVRQQMEGVAEAISARSITAPKDLAKSYYYLASAGMDAKQSMMALPQIERFAVAGAFDMATATDLVTDAQMALGLSSKDAGKNLQNLVKVSDALALANMQSNATMQQFSEALTTDAAVASRSLSMELETVMATLNAYAAQGIKGAHAGSMLGRATRLLASSYMDNEKAFHDMGIEVVNAQGEYRNFIDVIADMERAFSSLTKPQIKVRLEQLGFAALAQKSILPFLGMSDAMREWEKEQRSAAGTTEQIATKQMESFSSQMKIVRNQITLLAMDIGKTLAPAIKSIGDVIKGAVVHFRGMSDESKRMTILIAAGAAAIGPALMLIGSLVGMVAFAFSVLGTIVTAAVAAIGFLVTPLGLVTAGLIGLLTWTFPVEKALGSLGTLLDDLKGTAEKAFRGMKDAVKAGDLKLAIEIAMVAVEIAFRRALFTLTNVWNEWLENLNKTMQEKFPLISWWVESTFYDIPAVVTELNELRKSLWEVWVAAGSQGGELYAEDIREQFAKLDKELTKGLPPVGIDEILPPEVRELEDKLTSLVEKAAGKAANAAKGELKKGIEEIPAITAGVGIAGEAAQKAWFPEMGGLVDDAEVVNDLTKEHNALIEEGKRLVEQLRSPQEKYNDTLKELEKIHELKGFGEGVEGLEMYGRAVEAARKEFEDARSEIEKAITPKIDTTQFRTGSEAIESMFGRMFAARKEAKKIERITSPFAGKTLAERMAMRGVPVKMMRLPPIVSETVAKAGAPIGAEERINAMLAETFAETMSKEIAPLSAGGFLEALKLSTMKERPELGMPTTEGVGGIIAAFRQATTRRGLEAVEPAGKIAIAKDSDTARHESTIEELLAAANGKYDDMIRELKESRGAAAGI